MKEDADLSRIEAMRSNRCERKVIWLRRKGVIMHCSIPFRDRDDKIVILQEQGHDVAHWFRIYENLVILNAFSLDRDRRHVV
jgi:hypothetical protein